MSQAIKALIGLGLESFDADLDRKVVLQYAACARRLAKINAALLSGVMQVGERRHELVRWLVDELHSSQYYSTPAAHTLQLVNELQLSLTANFLSKCRADNNKFDRVSAKRHLREAWQLEARMLKDGTDYWSAVHSLHLGEMFVESAWISFDHLGHLLLCVLQMAPPKWRHYAMEAHLDSVKRLAAGGSHTAIEFLKNSSTDNPNTSPTNEELAQRFFYGDLEILQRLKEAYSRRS